MIKISAPAGVCRSNLRQLGLILDLYASENEGRLPFIDDTMNNFIFEGDNLYPEYMTDAAVLACPLDPANNWRTNFRLVSNEHHPGVGAGTVHPDCLADFSYCYLGWIVTSDREVEALFKAYDGLSPIDYDKDITVAQGRGNGGGKVIYRLDKNLFSPDSDGIYGILDNAATFTIDPSKTAANIPVMWDKPSFKESEFNHRRSKDEPLYGNVLYLDGHVKKVPFPSKFPMTKTMARLLDERPRAQIPDCE
jgi:prepilin-type processing-associated H-X9-DG protein